MDLDDGRDTDKRRNPLGIESERNDEYVETNKLSVQKKKNNNSYLKASHLLRHHGHSTFNGSHQSTDHIFCKQLGTVGHEAAHGCVGKETRALCFTLKSF